MAQTERQSQALGVRRTTRVHAVCDRLGRPIALALTAGSTSDIRTAPPLITAAGRMTHLAADPGCESNSLRRGPKAAGTEAIIIPGARNRQWPVQHDRTRFCF
jgi:hypothetical protein